LGGCNLHAKTQVKEFTPRRQAEKDLTPSRQAEKDLTPSRQDAKLGEVSFKIVLDLVLVLELERPGIT
jgi:hypothetical protein